MIILPALTWNWRHKVALFIGAVVLFFAANAGTAHPAIWRVQWPKTDFTNTSIDFDEILSGGPPKDGIPSIDKPRFATISEVGTDLAPTEPVVTLVIDGAAKAYPLSVLIWHEIVNDELAGTPVSVTFCPLCNSAIVFDRRVGDRVLEFGTTGKLRFSDLVMYDRQTETWWQQFIGEGIVGDLTGSLLTMLPVRVEAFASFQDRFPDGLVLVPPRGGLTRSYGATPYSGYDTSPRPFLFRGPLRPDIAPLAYVIAVGDEAWSLDLLQAEGTIETGELVISWTPGMNSALDARAIAAGRDLGNVVVQRKTANGLEDAVHDLTFAFNFNAFFPDGVLHQ